MEHVEFFVLDEADRMLDMGFIHDVKKILPKLPKTRQTMFFSATMPLVIADLAKNILKNPEYIKVDPVSSSQPRAGSKVSSEAPARARIVDSGMVATGLSSQLWGYYRSFSTVGTSLANIDVSITVASDKYATGLSAAIALSQGVLNGGKKELDLYLNFLKSGGSKFPLDLLRDAGVDMESPQPVETAMKHLGKLVDELEDLLA